MSDNKLLLHILKKVRDTQQKREYGICGEVQKRLKKYYMVGRGFSDKGPDYPKRCNAVVREQGILGQLMLKWPDGLHSEDNRYPVEGNGRRFEVAMEAGELWSNPRRIALLNWLIKELENGNS